MILLPLESMLSTDVTALADAIARERESKMEISPIHGQALYQSYFLRLKEACHPLRPLVASVTSSVKELHATVTRLARTASIHAGNLHKVISFQSSELLQFNVSLLLHFYKLLSIVLSLTHTHTPHCGENQIPQD